jgi:hypothetical protein
VMIAPLAEGIVLPFPRRRDDVLRFIKRHHYTRRAPGVWSVAYAIINRRDQIQGVAVYGPPPYPSIARAFVRDPQHVNMLTWQARLVGAGISSAELDVLLHFANADLEQRGFWWVQTLTDPTSKVIDGALVKLLQQGFVGEVYRRNDWLYLGYAGGTRIEGFLIDGKPVHVRQGAITLTLSNVHERYPGAQIRVLKGNAKQRWAYVLGSQTQRAERMLLMKYHVQPYEAITQPRLLGVLGVPIRN